ncbi:G-type lectin S-receptor-like serine/threonine-protein kinase LECRK1 [Tanacetum coccineum]
MAFMLLIFVRVFLLLVTEGSLIDKSASHNISLNSSLTPDTNPSWLSPSGLFAFGFYRQDDGFAVGIWLTSKPNITVVWTANQDDPPLSSNSSIELTVDGWLLVHTTTGKQNLTTDQTDPATSASMLDSGNFVLYNHSDFIWESFDYPCDTLLEGQALYRESKLVSSVSASQHSSGRFGLYMQPDGNLVAYLVNSSHWPEDAYWSSGTFSFSSTLNLDNSSGSLYLTVYDGTRKTLYDPPSSSRLNKTETVVYHATLNPYGNFVLRSTIFTTHSSLTETRTEWVALQDPCDVKGVCGINSYCSSTAGNDTIPECHCFPGFLFFDNTTNGKFLGCYRNFTDEEACSQRLKLSYSITTMDNMSLGIHPYYVMKLTQEACSKSCMDDCYCWVAVYSTGLCKLLKAPIIYAAHRKSGVNYALFIKTSSLNYQVQGVQRPLPAPPQKISVVVERKKLVSILAITLAFLAILCTVMAISTFFFYRMHVHRYASISENVNYGLISDHFTLRSFSFDELHKATDGFKELISRNSIGDVYKGFISDGKKAVAVKRLHRMFDGGEFRAEITAIAQTHHRNLVRLLGFCIHGATKLLVYEFMSNGSLADLLLDSETHPGWKERVRLALDVARGILYLHEECETRIIHCNINPNNILFDELWTAKISDFGLSKLLRPNQSGTLTGVRGTRGYLAPEWHKNILISTKVDIYSFGVLLLEILCCSGETEIDISSDDKIRLSTWVYNCFVNKELDRLTGDEEVDICMCEKMVKVGLLCIQDDPDARPSIKDVILMLEGTTDIPTPPSPTPLI